MLDDQGIECHVLSPTHLPKTQKSAKQKTDVRDAQMLLEQVRAFVLAGNRLPVVWTPPQRLRQDRELVRARVDVADETTRVKLKILSMLKRLGISKPTWYTTRWPKRFVKWLRALAVAMDLTLAAVLEPLIDRYELYRQEQNKLDEAIVQLSRTERYELACRQLLAIVGVGRLSAMAFLTEMGDLMRFHNRREVAAYLGLCPASYESGETNNRKGRITRQGPSRLRKMLCQSAWVSVIHCKKASAEYHRIKQGQSKRTKKALVAIMRKLAIRMWHLALACGVSLEICGRGGPHDLTPPGEEPSSGVAVPTA